MCSVAHWHCSYIVCVISDVLRLMLPESLYCIWHLLCTNTGLVVLPCSSTSCRYGARCGFTRGYPECICPLESDCPAEDRPVCGSDAQNYPNICVLTARACLMRKDVIAEYDGPCGMKCSCCWSQIILMRDEEKKQWLFFFQSVFIFCFLMSIWHKLID